MIATKFKRILYPMKKIRDCTVNIEAHQAINLVKPIGLLTPRPLLTKSSDPLFNVIHVWLSLLTRTLYEVTQSLLVMLWEREGQVMRGRKKREERYPVRLNSTQMGILRWSWGQHLENIQTSRFLNRWMLVNKYCGLVDHNGMPYCTISNHTTCFT